MQLLLLIWSRGQLSAARPFCGHPRVTPASAPTAPGSKPKAAHKAHWQHKGLGGTSRQFRGVFIAQPVALIRLRLSRHDSQPVTVMGTVWFGSAPSKSKAWLWSGVGLAVTVIAALGWVGSTTWLRARLERSASRVGKLCAGKPCAVSLVAALRWARSETRAAATGVSRWARAAAGSSVRMSYADPETQETGLSRVCQIGRVLIALHRSRCRLSIALAVYRSRRTSKAKPNMGMISQLARQLRTTEGWWPARFRSNSSSRSAGSSTLPAR